MKNYLLEFSKIIGLPTILMLSILLGQNHSSQAQINGRLTFEYIDVSHGLSNNYVSKIISDERGLKWFACEGGINIYDGFNFTLIKPNERYDGLRNENIETLFKDSNGKIWVGTKSGGLSCYDPILDSFANFNKLLIGDKQQSVIRITAIEEDFEGNIWVATWGQGIHILSVENNKNIKSIAKGKIIADVTKDIYGNIWFASVDSLYKFVPSEDRLSTIPTSFGTPMDLFIGKNSNMLLIGSTSGLFQFDTETYKIAEFEESKRLNFRGINAINLDAKGRIWVGSWTQGLYISNANQDNFEKLSLLPAHLKNSNYETVLDVFIDQYGLIWIATGYGGIVKVHQDNSVRYTANTFAKANGLPDNNIQSIFKDHLGNTWCGTWGGGIGYSTDGNNFIQLPGTTNLKVSCFYQSGDSLLVGTGKGLYIYSVKYPANGPFFNTLGNKKIKDIYLDHANRLWVGTQQNGLYVYDYKKGQLLDQPVNFRSDEGQSGALKTNRISTISEDLQGKLWIGTYNGLYSFNSTDSTFIRKDRLKESNFPSVVILSVYTQDGDTLWVGVPGGLLKVLNTPTQFEMLKVYNTSQGLKNDYVTAVTMDDAGNIWLSNAAGIATLRRSEDVIINMSENEEYLYSMNIDSYLNDGEYLYFGGSNGMLSFDPMNVNLIFLAPEIVFKDLRVDNKLIKVDDKVNGQVILENSIGYTDQINVSYKVSVVSLSFVTTDFMGEHNLNYYYRIVGLQDEWINNGNNGEISFIGPGQGEYILELKSTRDKLNFGKIQQMKITVAAAPWVSDLAFLIYFLTAIAIILVIRQVAINRTRLIANLEMTKLGKEQEHDLYEAKLRFFTNISHELRTPLTLIVSPLTEILNDSKLGESLRERLNYIESNANRLLDLINQLLDFRKADHGLLKLQVAEGNFAKFAKEVFISFQGHADSVGIKYEYRCSQGDIPLTYDRDKMEVVLRNLLANAFKYTQVKGKIIFSIDTNESHCLISVKDNGKGISKEHQDKIFDRFYQIQDSESIKMGGSGIGLSLSHKITELHKGEINIESNPGRGAEFIVKIPLGDEHFNAKDFMPDFRDSEDIDNYEMDTIIPSDVIPVNGESEEKSVETLLIIDDNADIRNYLQILFQTDYKIITAINGINGKDIAEQTIPDLIISDIMMPEMDGLEMCKLLKSQIATSHIPILLLTARTSIVHEVDGLDGGADDYVKKPFDASIIKSRVASLLANRKKVRSYLMNKVRFEPDSKIEAVDFEEKFIDDASAIVESHLDDHKFDVAFLSSELCMSQSTLYRKIRSLTGMSIAGFIRSIRLRKASEILITEDSKLSAVAYMVGFNDYNYFKKTFTVQFGMTPRDYREGKRK